jgi:hypothetical protein
MSETARTTEVAKLGANGQARVDNVSRYLDAAGLGVLKSGMITADHVVAWESHITQQTTQGVASSSTAHRVSPDDRTIPNYENMSFEQRRLAQDQIALRRSSR